MQSTSTLRRLTPISTTLGCCKASKRYKMANLNVTDLPEETMSALTARAHAEGYPDRLAYVRSLLNKAAQEPLIAERYAYRLCGKQGKGVIRRMGNHLNVIGGGASNFSEEEFEAYKKASDLMRRNGPGDREKAVALLQGTFEEVVEIPVWRSPIGTSHEERE